MCPGWGQPYLNIVGLVFTTLCVFLQGYTVFLPGNWDIGSFFTYWTMIFACILFFVGWKVVKKTKFVRPEEADLVWEKPAIDAYEATIDPPESLFKEVWHATRELLHMRPKAKNEDE